MFKRIRDFCLTLGVFSLVAVPFAIPAMVYADNISTGVCQGVNSATDANATLNLNDTSSATGCSTSDTSGSSLQTLLKLIINVFSVVVGFVAVVMIIVGGVKYITSGGESGSVSGAKNTIVYAIIGLIIVALAQVIVHFVLAKASTVTTG